MCRSVDAAEEGVKEERTPGNDTEVSCGAVWFACSTERLRGCRGNINGIKCLCCCRRKLVSRWLACARIFAAT